MRQQHKPTATLPPSPGRRQLLVSAAAVAVLAACGGSDEGSGFTGAVYAGSNRVSGNTVAAFGRNADGTLTPIAEYATGGLGGVFDGTNDGLDPLISEDTIVAVNNRFLLAVNAGSNSISALRINADFSLSLIGTASTGGVGPNSIAYRDGLVYVANTDSDGAFTGAADQRGNITGLRFDANTGQLTPIANSTRQLGNRPSDIEFSPSGGHLIVSSWNSGSTLLAAGSDAEIVVYGVQGDGSLSAAPVSSAASTLRGNAAGRNLPSAIGFAAVQVGTRTFIVASEAREFLASGAPAMLPMFQTASVSTWELNANGSLTPRSLDVLSGPTITTGPSAPTSACWIVVSPDRTTFWVAHASGGVISSFRLNADGTASLIDGRAAVAMPAVVGPTPLATADGLVDIAVSSDGRYIYQLLGLRGSVTVYRVGASGSLSQVQKTAGLLPMTNTAGLVSVDKV
jgi:6-phosphogluconolactonase (cycloisomerase 2 family)